MNAFTPGPHGVREGIQLPVQEKSGLKNDLYTAGVFQDESHYGREKSHGFTEFYRIDSDYSKDRC